MCYFERKLIGMLVRKSDEPYAEEIAEKILQRNRKSKGGLDDKQSCMR